MHKKIMAVLPVVLLAVRFLLYAGDMEDQQKQMEQLQAQAEQIQARAMEELKEQNPQAYAAAMQAQAASRQLSQVIQDYNAQKISYEQAKSRLRPLVGSLLESRLKSAPAQIERLKKQITRLESMQNNPRQYIDRQIDVYLGKAQPDPGDFF